MVHFIKDLKFLFVEICFYLNEKRQKEEEWVEKEKTDRPRAWEGKSVRPAQANQPDRQRFGEAEVLPEEFGKEDAVV